MQEGYLKILKVYVLVESSPVHFTVPAETELHWFGLYQSVYVSACMQKLGGSGGMLPHENF